MKDVHYRTIEQKDNPYLAELVRYGLRSHGLDIPGTAYFDPHLEHLYEFYTEDPLHRSYFVAADEADVAIGGIGVDVFEGLPNCCELQKLYIDKDWQGCGISYTLINILEEEARRLGYQTIYLETHSNLQAAIHVYQNAGYRQIERPQFAMHETMDIFMIKEL